MITPCSPSPISAGICGLFGCTHTCSLSGSCWVHRSWSHDSKGPVRDRTQVGKRGPNTGLQSYSSHLGADVHGTYGGPCIFWGLTMSMYIGDSGALNEFLLSSLVHDKGLAPSQGAIPKRLLTSMYLVFSLVGSAWPQV